MNPALVTAIVVVALALVVVASTVHVVPTGSRALVMRWGLVSRVVGPGLVRVVPGLDRVRILDMQPHRAEPVPVTAITRDGVDVRVDLSVLWRLVEPERSLRAVPDVAGVEGRASATAHEWGVAILEVDVLDVELRAGPELVRLLG